MEGYYIILTSLEPDYRGTTTVSIAYGNGMTRTGNTYTRGNQSVVVENHFSETATLSDILFTYIKNEKLACTLKTGYTEKDVAAVPQEEGVQS